MTDIRLAPSNLDPFLPPVAVSFDWLMTPVGQLDTTNELATAVIVALGTDRLAEDDDILPGLDDTDRRGWWGDLDAAQIYDGWPIGTRLWLLTRHKITGPGARQGSSTARAREYAYEALQPFIDRGICRDVDVTAVRSAIDRIDVSVTLTRGPEPDLTVRYAVLWQDIVSAAQTPTVSPVLPGAPPGPTVPTGLSTSIATALGTGRTLARAAGTAAGAATVQSGPLTGRAPLNYILLGVPLTGGL